MLRDQISEGNFSSVMVFVLLGFFWTFKPPGASIWTFLSCLYIHLNRKWSYHNNHKDGLCSPNTHVFLSGKFFLSGNLLCVCDSPQDSNEPLDSREKHFFTKLCHPNVLLPCSGCHRGIPSGSDGLWPLCVHLQPSALCIMRPVGCCCLAQWNSGPDKADMSGVLTAFLWFQPNRPLFLWHPPIDPAGLWGHCA